MNRDELKKILAKHVAWVACDPCGERADLQGADLRDAILRGADLQGAILRGADLRDADLRDAILRGADLQGAILRGADLRDADLRGASLWGAILRGADLQGADMRGADMRGADMRGAKGVHKEYVTPLMLLLDQPGPIRAYKMVTADLKGPYYPEITYTIGADIVVDNADTDDAAHCSAGISVATLDWCLAQWSPGYRILIVEFTAADIACIPIATDGKFRLHRCRVVGEKDLSGLVPGDADSLSLRGA